MAQKQKILIVDDDRKYSRTYRTLSQQKNVLILIS